MGLFTKYISEVGLFTKVSEVGLFTKVSEVGLFTKGVKSGYYLQKVRQLLQKVSEVSFMSVCVFID